MSQHYSDESRADDKYSLPDVEVFYISEAGKWDTEDGETLERGWYYWYASLGACRTATRSDRSRRKTPRSPICGSKTNARQG